MKTKPAVDAKAAGRELLGAGESLAVASFRRRLLGGLDIPEGRGRWALDVGCGDGLEAVELLRAAGRSKPWTWSRTRAGRT